jgi:hypothetical protein
MKKTPVSHSYKWLYPSINPVWFHHPPDNVALGTLVIEEVRGFTRIP